MGQGEGFLSVGPEGHPLQRTKFRPRWANACARAGVTWLHFHDLRGSGATWHAEAGGTLRETMDLLGHRSRTAALRYQHAAEEQQREVERHLGVSLMEAMDEVPPDADIVEIAPR